MDNFELERLVRDALELKLDISDLFVADENVGHGCDLQFAKNADGLSGIRAYGKRPLSRISYGRMGYICVDFLIGT